MATPQTLTTKQLQAGFGVGHMTIFNWRAGSAKREKLPCTTTDGRVTFKLAEVKAWAKKHDLPFTAPTGEAEVVKPGPKPKATAPAKKAAKAEKPGKLARAIGAHAKKTEAKKPSRAQIVGTQAAA